MYHIPPLKSTIMIASTAPSPHHGQRPSNRLMAFIANPLVASAAKVALFAIGALVAFACGSSLAIPLLTIAAAMVACQLAVKLCNHYHVEIICKAQLAALSFQQEYPYLQAIAFIVAMIIAPFSILAASGVGFLVGTFAGLTVAADHYRQRVAEQSGISH
jgi:small-conductance mechanosensitive channel